MTTLKTLAAAAGLALAAGLAAPAANASIAAPVPTAAVQTAAFAGPAVTVEQVKFGHRGFRRGHGFKKFGVTGGRRLGYGHRSFGKFGHSRGFKKHGHGHKVKKGFFFGVPFFKGGVVVK
ncbi:MAG: hypothetical protein AAFN79_04880 [Pseudomonadota bacterium]